MGIAGLFLMFGLIFGYYIIRASAVLSEEKKRKAAERALKEREKLLGMLVRHTPLRRWPCVKGKCDIWPTATDGSRTMAWEKRIS
jgi:hypothetical protein